jgi:hypothetical protein
MFRVQPKGNFKNAVKLATQVGVGTGMAMYAFAQVKSQTENVVLEKETMKEAAPRYRAG